MIRNIVIIFLLSFGLSYADCSEYLDKHLPAINFDIHPSGEPSMVTIEVICYDGKVTVGKVTGRYLMNKLFILHNFTMLKKEGDTIRFPLSKNMIKQ